jgi:hypothetical protein
LEQTVLVTSLTATHQKRALLIGIDKYPKLTQLEGCVNDVQLMRGILQDNFGFPPENITLLANDQATRDAILAALDALVERTGQDDVVVIHYAGHGSQMTDREDDEPDGLDETIMPFDAARGEGMNRDITDDEIHLRLVGLGKKTSYTTLIFDSCHSGTITRDVFGVKSRSVEPDKRPVSELPPSPIPEAARQAMRESGPSGWMPHTNQYVLLAGCRDEETSFEYRPPEGAGKVTHGALTYFLAQQLRQATPGTSYRDVFERAAAKVNANNGNQHPQMEGRADREVFGVKDLEPMQFVRVTARSGDSVTLAAGAAQGMTIGSTWSIYPQGVKRADAVEPLGTVEIAAVRAVSSDARITVEKTPGAIANDARAVETLHAYGDLRLAVQLVAATGLGSSLEQLRGALEASPLLKVVGDRELAAARVYVLAPRTQVTSTDPVPQLAVVSAPTWAVVTENGELMMPPKRVDDYMKVKENLEKLARYRQALALDNPDAASALRGRFSLDLLRLGTDGNWIVAEPESAGGQVVFEEGERIGFRITSHHDAPVFVNLLDFGLTGSVSLVHPAQGAKEKLAPEITFERGTRPDDNIFTLKIPKEFPYADNPARAAIEGTETLKLFVTQGEADFAFLTQQGVRAVGAARSGSPLMLLWQTAAGGAVTRDITVSVPVGEEDWTTVVRPFLLRRSGAAALKPDGKPLRLGELELSTLGLTGRVQTHAGKSGRAEAAELARDDLTRALDAAGVEVRQTVEISDAREVGPATREARGKPAMELQVRDPGPDYGQMVMTTDEQRIVSWHFAPTLDAAKPGGRGAGPPGLTRTYVLPRTVHETPPAGAATRGLVGAVGKKFLKVLVFPLLEPGIGAIGETFVLKWELKRRPYRVRSFGPEDYATPEAGSIDADGWRRLGAGRALLMVHGTFSQAHTAFGAMPKEFVTALHGRYGGRVFALDHLTLSHDPKQNVNWLVEQMPDGTALDLDIICHSRGGLVSRMLSEKQGELALGSRRLRVGKVVFVGAPNAGTILADGQHMGDFIDTYTNLLNFLPDNGVTEILEGIITVAKQLAVGILKGLPGLQSMRPGGEFAEWLNTGARAGETRYFALASDFTPTEAGLKQYARDRLMDKIFNIPNDLVVPTDGVFAKNGSGFFPIEDRYVFQGNDGVAHSGYFANRVAREKILGWLSA